jgi:hypothetical protein
MKRPRWLSLRSLKLALTLAVTLSIVLTLHFSCNVNSGSQNVIGLINIVTSSTNPRSLPKKTDPPGIIQSEIPKAPASFPEPEIVVVSPAVRITKVDQEKGLVKALFKIALMNLGGRLAKNLKTEWIIKDNGDLITNPDDWNKTIKQPPWSPEDLPSGKVLTFIYGPDIGARGVGTLTLALVITYEDPSTGKPFRKEFNGFVDYSVPSQGDSKGYLLSPLPEKH